MTERKDPRESTERDAVLVGALKYHTYQGVEYNTFDTYKADPADVSSLQAQGMAAPTNLQPSDKPPEVDPPARRR